jgi:hypothetical protein
VLESQSISIDGAILIRGYFALRESKRETGGSDTVKEKLFHSPRFQIDMDHHISQDLASIQKYFDDFHNLEGGYD